MCQEAIDRLSGDLQRARASVASFSGWQDDGESMGAMAALAAAELACTTGNLASPGSTCKAWHDSVTEGRGDDQPLN